MTSVAVPAARPQSAPLWGIAGATVMLAGLVAGAAQVGTIALLAVVAVVQALLVLGWLEVADPPSPAGVVAIAVATAAAADVFAAFGSSASLTAVATSVGLAVPATIAVQLVRGVARARVTEAMAACLTAAVGVASLATLVVLRRQAGGDEAVTAAALAAAVAVLTARGVDRVLPVPRVADGVERGGLGIILGSMTGTAATVFYAASATTLTPRSGALLGWAVALVAVLADLAASYVLLGARSGRAVSAPAGPVVALAAAAPVAYLLGVLVVGS